MLRKGQEIQGVRETDVPPLFSEQTLRVCAALAAGYQFASQQPFLDATEVFTSEDGTDGKRREVTWVFEVNRPVEFRKPDGTRESVSFQEFWTRLQDEAWCEEHRDHPIAYLHNLIRLVHGYQHKLRAKEPHEVYGEPLHRHLRLRKGPSSVLVRADWTAEEQEAELTRLGW